jgi:20S proteasome alpha/beta subunit
LDNYGALQKLPFGAHGLGANFLLSILDQGYSRDMSREDALSLIQECFRQLKLRFVMNSPQLPSIKCIDQHGCHVIQPAIANI